MGIALAGHGLSRGKSGLKSKGRGTLDSLELKAKNYGQNTTWVGEVLADESENGASSVELPSSTRLTGQRKGAQMIPFCQGLS